MMYYLEISIVLSNKKLFLSYYSSLHPFRKGLLDLQEQFSSKCYGTSSYSMPPQQVQVSLRFDIRRIFGLPPNRINQHKCNTLRA